MPLKIFVRLLTGKDQNQVKSIINKFSIMIFMTLLEVSPFIRRAQFLAKGEPADGIAAVELRAVEKDMEDVVGHTAVAVAHTMRSLVPVPRDATKDVLKPRKDLLDNLVAEAMIGSLNDLHRTVSMIDGEGAKDIANGHEIRRVVGIFGRGGSRIDGVNDPLEGTTFAAQGRDGASSVIAISEPGGFIATPLGIDYMDKLFAPNIEGLSLDDPPEVTLKKILNGLRFDDPKKLRLTVLERPRNRAVIEAGIKLGVDLDLIDGGDLLPSSVAGEWSQGLGAQVVMGIGGWPEGVIAAAAAKAKGNTFVEARAWHENPEIRNANARLLSLQELVPGERSKTFMVLAHITDDPKYTGQPGVRFYTRSSGAEASLVAVTTMDNRGVRFAQNF